MVEQQVEGEVVVVDDGSTDSSAKIIQEKFPFVKLIRTKNQGAAKARNTGIEESKGEFIQFLDADDLLAKGKIKKQLKLLKQSEADVAYGNWQRLVKDKNSSFKKGEKVQRKLKNPEVDLFTQFWCPPAVYLFRRSIVEKAGGFKERFPVIQDARFVLDCALAGAKFIYCPQAMAYYRQHNLNSLSKKSWFAFHRDIYNNAKEIKQIWQKEGGITKERNDALLTVYGYLGRAAFKKNMKMFNFALRELESLNHRYIPKRPKHLKLVSQLVGYKNAEYIAWWYRKLRKIRC